MSRTPIAADRLRSFVERIEALQHEHGIRGAQADVHEVLREAGAMGFDKLTISRVVARRRMDSTDRKLQDDLLELYERAIGDR